jgi:hypothetical protein
MNLSRIRTELAKLQEFAAERERIGKLPLTIFVLPHNARCPDSDVNLALPRVRWRNERAICIVYDVDAGAPTAEDIARLTEATP